MNPLDLFRCFAAVFDPNASPQLLNECNLRGGIFQSYWPVWALLGTALLAAAGLVVRKYLRRPLPTADEASGGYTPPPFDPDRISARADESSELTAQLDRLLEEADAIRQRLEQDRLDDARQEGWTSDAEQFVALNFQHFATDFRIAREPNQRLGGAHQSDIWARLKRIAAQMEVLREIKRGLRARPVSQPSSDAIRAGQEALRAKEEAEGRGRAIRRALERLKAEHEDALSKSPHLTWSGVSVVAYRQGYEVRVECANVGPTRAQVQVGSRVTAVASQPEMTGPQDDSGDEVVTLAAEVREPIEFYEFSVPGVIHPVGPYLPFILRMRCPEASPLLDRTVFWRIVYKDDDDKLGFITDCSAIIDFTLGTFSVGAVVLDQSSREARHEKFKKDVAMPSGDA